MLSTRACITWCNSAKTINSIDNTYGHLYAHIQMYILQLHMNTDQDDDFYYSHHFDGFENF